MDPAELKTSQQQAPPREQAGPDPTADTQRAFLVLLFNKYRAALMRHVERMVHSREDAAELVQETYVRVMRQVQTSRFEAAARAYLFQTATNLARDHHRRQKFRAHGRLDEVDESQLPLGCSPDQAVAAEQLLLLLRASIRDLPPDTRAVFFKARMQNMSYAQIGQELGMSIRTVERRMAEAMTVLCEKLRSAP